MGLASDEESQQGSYGAAGVQDVLLRHVDGDDAALDDHVIQQIDADESLEMSQVLYLPELAQRPSPPISFALVDGRCGTETPLMLMRFSVTA